ncbi:MAG: protein kinase [Myxococcota bacterium]
MAGRSSGEYQKRRIGGRYELREIVGRGAMAQVYRADDTLRGREVALKVVRREVVENPTSAARFQQEVKAASKLLHPNIVRVYEWGVDRGQAFIAMELVAGEDLFELIGRRGPLPQALAVEVAIEVCLALAVAHRWGVVHRDLKPENVMVVPGSPPQIKLLDFGIAKLRSTLGDESSTEDTSPKSITMTGTAVGTPSHMAPEQARGAPVDGRTDIYGLGVLLYEMLTGRLPFEGKNPVEIALKHVREIPLPPQHHRADLHPRLNGLVVKALAKSPSMRPASADAMRATLESLLPEVAGDDTAIDDDEELPVPTKVGVHPEVEAALAARGARRGRAPVTAIIEGDGDAPAAAPTTTDDDDDPTRQRDVDERGEEVPTRKESRSRLVQRRGRWLSSPSEDEPATLERASKLSPRIADAIEDEPTVTFLDTTTGDVLDESTRVSQIDADDAVETLTRKRPASLDERDGARSSRTGITRVQRPVAGPTGTVIQDPEDDSEAGHGARQRQIASAVAAYGDPADEGDDDDDDDDDEVPTTVAPLSPAAAAVAAAAATGDRAVRASATPWPGGRRDDALPPTGALPQPPELFGSEVRMPAAPPATPPWMDPTPPPIPPPPAPLFPPSFTPSGGVPSAAPRGGSRPAGPHPGGEQAPSASPLSTAWPYRGAGGAGHDLDRLLRQMPEPERYTGALVFVTIMLVLSVAAFIWALL